MDITSMEENAGGLRSAVPPRPRELKVEDALLYLDQVKMEFHDKPHIYNEFLEIMKNFKAQSITTPGVIDRVKNLFRGYNKLILGFNTFLPEGEGYKIELTPEEQEGPNLSRSGIPQNMVSDYSGMNQGYSTANYDRPMLMGQGVPVAPSPQGMGMSTTAMKPPQQMQQQHAITYVTTIRNRFANEPETYRAFLRILHTYQKEQKGIKDVLEQVSLLFADHPDLLMEFTYFLPDSVQEQAKERLQRAAKESEARRKGTLTQSSLNNMMYGGVGQGGSIGMNGPGMVGTKRRRWGGTDMGGRTGSMGSHMDGSGGRGGRSGPMRKLQTGNRRSGMGLDSDSQGDLSMMGNTGSENLYGSVKNENMRSDMKNNRTGYPPTGSTGVMSRIPTGLSSNKLQSNHISSTAERRFFDQVKEVMMQTSRDTWQEFVKCLELFSNGALSKTDMLVLVKDLFGGIAGSELFEEFDRLLTARADYEARGADMWYAVPLSEVDFSQCRKCTPSYRALPKDFPKPICSERRPEEAAVVNDQWVSIPIGSEESYSFKHMRKNQYEEALFKTEDERFEIDMIIDSNMSTIRVLEPLQQEILQLQTLEEAVGQTGSTVLSPKFNFQLDKRGLTTVHLNAITRLYGEHGAEILDLLRKNPIGTIPVLLKRLKQKDLEWRKARAELSKQWKEIMVKNYEKSFDHRSFYFRQQDKRLCNQRALVAQIKSALEGHSSNPVHTTPYADTDPNGNGTSQEEFEQAKLSRTVSPQLLPYLGNMNPHLVMKYDMTEYSVHRDIYRLLTHAAEHTSASHLDKDKATALWRDLFRVFFNLPLDFLYTSSSSQQNGSLSRYGSGGSIWAVGIRVITIYGSGKILSYRPSDNIYQVALSYGVGYLQPSAILGAEELSTQALNIIGVTQNPTTGADMVYDGLVQSSNGPGSSPNGDNGNVKDPSKLFYGTQMMYIFLRLHHIIYIRLCLARQLAKSESSRSIVSHPLAYLEEASDDEGEKTGEVLDAQGHPLVGKAGVNRYNVYLSQLYALVSGTIDVTRYEEICRSLLGNRAFILYTLDKVVAQTLKCLQALAADETIHKLVGLFVYHRSHWAKESPSHGVASDFYLAHVGAILAQTMEDVYRLQLVCPTDPTSSQLEVACQFIGIVGGSGQAQLPSELKAPQLVLDDDDDDDPVDPTILPLPVIPEHAGSTNGESAMDVDVDEGEGEGEGNDGVGQYVDPDTDMDNRDNSDGDDEDEHISIPLSRGLAN